MPVLPSLRTALASLALFALSCVHAADAQDRTFTFDIPAQPLAKAILAFSAQTGLQVITSGATLPTRDARAVTGRQTLETALNQLLAGTGLKYQSIGQTTITLVPAQPQPQPAPATQQTAVPAPALRLAQADESVAAAAEQQEAADTRGIAEILVSGSRLLNTDIGRSVDDVQPYVILDRKRIASSAASSIQDLLRQVIPANAIMGGNAQVPNVLAVSQVNLRGFGTDRTLILVDGRRLPVTSYGYTMSQPDISHIPLDAVERIEVLASSASGIYGGGATGGVINIVLRRDYVDRRVSVTYGNALDTEVSNRRVDALAGFSFRGGETRGMLTLKMEDGTELLSGERDFSRRARNRILQNNPAYFYNSFNPPFGRTTNFRSVDNSPLFGPGTPSIAHVPVGYAGGGGINAFLPTAGRYNLDPAPGPQRDAYGMGERRILLRAPDNQSANLTLRHSLTSSLELFGEIGVTETRSSYPEALLTASYDIQATAPNNPFGKAIKVTIPAGDTEDVRSKSSSERAVAGLIAHLPGKWTAELSLLQQQTSFIARQGSRLSGGNARTRIGNGTVDVLRDLELYPIDMTRITTALGKQTAGPFESRVRTASLRSGGPLFELPAGPIVLNTLIEHVDLFIDGTDTRWGDFVLEYYPPREQQVNSAYVELRVPLLRSLEMQLSGRLDRYRTEGAAQGYDPAFPPTARQVVQRYDETNPTVGFLYKPLKSLMLRASWSTGFVPPTPVQLVPGDPTLGLVSGLDPLRGFTPAGPYDLYGGGNPNLTPETSESFSAGLVIKPPGIDGLRFSVDYTRIEQKNAIISLGTLQTIISNSEVLSSLVVRGPRLSTDPPGWAGPITLIRQAPVNAALQEVEAYDFQINYDLPTQSRGMFSFYALATVQTRLDAQLFAGQPVESNIGIGGGALKFKTNFGIDWEIGAVRTGIAGQYYDSYLVASPGTATAALIAAQGNNGVIPAQMYFDGYIGYRHAGSQGILAGTDLKLSVRNLLNASPPVDLNRFPLYSMYGDPRLASYSLSLSKSFR